MIQQTSQQWNTFENTFITKVGSNGFILKIKSLAHDEEIGTRVIKQHGDAISLLGVFGKSKKFNRDRLLGYILLYSGTPIVHMHTWFVSICYSEIDNIRRKDPMPIAVDEHIRLFKAGIGNCDYLLCYKAKTRKHDEAGFSDGAAHLETFGQWKDGL